VPEAGRHRGRQRLDPRVIRPGAAPRRIRFGRA
jgi:hypothetical protein